MTYRRGPERINVIAGKRYAAIGVMVLTAACSTEIQATPTQEIFPTQPQPTEVIPTPTPADLTISGLAPESNEIRAAFGEAVGAGGLSFPPRKVFNNSTIQGSLNRESLAPVLDSDRGVTQVVQVGDQRVCFPNMPEVLFNPNVPSGQDDWLQANGFIISYGEEQEIRFKGLGAVSLKNTEEDIICVNAVINKDNNPFGERRGKVLNVLMNSTTGEIYGTLPGIYDAEEDVRFDFSSGNVYIGNSTSWYVGDRMAEFAALPTSEPAIPQEVLPTNCMDSEAQAKVEADFLESLGYGTKEAAMDALEGHEDFRDITEWYGFDSIHTPYASHTLWTQVLGAFPVSLAEQPGFNDSDKALCLLVASPYYRKTNLPIVIGVQKDGQWAQISALFYQARVGGNFEYTGEEKMISSLEEGEEWINKELRGEVVNPSIQFQFIEPDKVNWWGIGADFARPLVQNPNSYTFRYTNNPAYLVDELGAQQLYYSTKHRGPNVYNFKVGDPLFGAVQIYRVVRDLNRQPGGDIGLFSNQVTLYK